MTCYYCDKKVIRSRFDWGYMILDEDLVVYAHMDCVAWDETMNHAETINQLESVLKW